MKNARKGKHKDRILAAIHALTAGKLDATADNIAKFLHLDKDKVLNSIRHLRETNQVTWVELETKGRPYKYYLPGTEPAIEETPTEFTCVVCGGDFTEAQIGGAIMTWLDEQLREAQEMLSTAADKCKLNNDHFNQIQDENEQLKEDFRKLQEKYNKLQNNGKTHNFRRS
jgi:hypothetical protein